MTEPVNTESTESTEAAASAAASIKDTAIKVITNPAGFFKEMPKDGGFGQPLVFMVVMGVVSALVGAVLSIFGIGLAGTIGMAILSIILVPIFTAIFGFVGAAILFIIWKILGSQESYETAYRCGAYMAAITPITAILNAIPYLGMIITLIWALYLVVTASTEVHKIKSQAAWIVFGILFLLFAFMSIGSQCAARKMQNEMAPWAEKLGNIDEMSPEEAGKAMGEFFKGLQQGSGENEAP